MTYIYLRKLSQCNNTIYNQAVPSNKTIFVIGLTNTVAEVLILTDLSRLSLPCITSMTIESGQRPLEFLQPVGQDLQLECSSVCLSIVPLR